MTWLVRLLLGYIVFTVKEEDVGRCAGLFLKNGVSVRFKRNAFAADVFKARKIEKILSGVLEYQKSEVRGLGGFIYKNRKRYGVMFAALLFTVVYVVSSDRVWDIRIEGCDAECAERVKDELAECGFYVGARWSSGDTNQIEVELLSRSSSASWLNINRRGNVAYITVIEKEVHSGETKEGYSNVVAEFDGIIEEITVERGVAAVKVGDSVKRGDLLISGVLPEELGGGFCYAEGSVYARISDSVDVTVSQTKKKKTVKESEILRFDVKIFGFSVNILNNYRNYDKECDIIDTTKDISLFGRKLPLSLSKQSAVSYSTEEMQISEEEMVREASSKMADLLSERLVDSTLLKIKTEGSFEDGEYKMKSSFICIEQIGSDLPFEVKIP